MTGHILYTNSKMALLLLGLVFWLTRLYQLKTLPPFVDETIYLRWIGTITADWSQWLLPLKEFGWEPLSIWVSSGLNLVLSDGLLSLRLTAAIFGFLTGLFLYLAVKTWFDRRTALFTLAVVWLSPIILLHDRLGLRGDALVSLAAALTFYGLGLRLKAKKMNGVYLIAAGLIIGLMSKTSAIVLPISVALAYLYFRPKLKIHDFAAGLLTLIPAAFYYFLGFLPAVLNKGQVFSLPLSGWGSLTADNLNQMLNWTYQYITWPVLTLMALGGVWLYLKEKKKFWLTMFLILPTWVLLVMTAKILFPRYLLPAIIFELTLAGVGLNYLREHLPKFLLPGVLIFFLPGWWFDYQLITNLSAADLPEIERWQYVTGWPSGYGLRELTDYLRFDSPQYLITENNDLVRSGVNYLWPEHSFTIVPLTDDGRLTQSLPASPSAYLALNIADQPPDGFSGELIKEFMRPENKSSIRLYRLTNVPIN